MNNQTVIKETQKPKQSRTKQGEETEETPVNLTKLERPTDDDLRVLSVQLGRPARAVLAIAARCSSGHPAVISTSPRLPGGSPFPTFYYLTCPAAVKACSQLEANQFMDQANAMLRDPEVASAYQKAHEAYLKDRCAFGVVPEIDQISAGGMPVRVKCLHALVGHALAAGAGVNPIGDWALDLAREMAGWSRETCDWKEE